MSQYIHDGVPDASAYALIHEEVKRRLSPALWEKLITCVTRGKPTRASNGAVGM